MFNFVLDAIVRPSQIDRDTALNRMERLSAVTHAMSALEYIARWRCDERTDSLTSAAHQLGVIDSLGMPNCVRRLLRACARPLVSRSLQVGRLVAAAALMVPAPRPIRGLSNAYLTLVGVLLYPRYRWGTDGSDQVAVHVQGAAAIARMTSDPVTQDALLWYVALQGVTSYGVSGWVKLSGDAWRSGTALGGVMRTRSYGCGRAYEWAIAHPGAAKLLSHSMLATESLFPLILVARGRLTRLLLGWATTFHLSNAVVMALGRFVPAFGAMHPAIAYVTGRKQARTRSSALPAVATIISGGAFAANTVVRHRREARVRTDPEASAHVTTRAGNVISARLRTTTTNASARSPLIVFEAGMLTTSMHYEWLRCHLDRFDTLTYSRAGYGASRRLSTNPYRLEEAVDDLDDLVRAVVPDRVLVLVGHSLGGHISAMYAGRKPETLGGIVYLDSTHPAQLRVSDRQQEGAKHFDRMFASTVGPIRMGWGTLLSRPEWIDQLPPHARARSLDEYRDHRLWSAASREWRAARTVFGEQHGAIPARPGSALVISAERTLRRDPAQEALHDELAQSHEHATRVVIREATHDSLITDRSHSLTVSRAIEEFALGLARATLRR